MHDIGFNKQKVKSIKIYSRTMLQDEQLVKLYELFKVKLKGARSVVSQENSVIRGNIGNLNVVVKHYKRGGVIYYFNSHHYISSFTSSRAKKEFQFLEIVRKKGVNAPKPIAYAIKGGFFYRNWLATEEIKNVKGLNSLGDDDVDKIEKYVKEVARQIKILIKEKIFHVDLHPGNVIYDDSGKVYILDFDKACFFKGSFNELRDKYILRWRRAVIKHGLSELLSEYLCANLRDNFNFLENDIK